MADHVGHMADNRLVKKIYGSITVGTNRGRLHGRWTDTVHELIRTGSNSDEDTTKIIS